MRRSWNACTVSTFAGTKIGPSWSRCDHARTTAEDTHRPAKTCARFRRAYSNARHGGPSGFGAWAGHLRFRGRGYQREHDASDVQALFASFSVLRAIQRLFVSSLVPLPHRPTEQSMCLFFFDPGIEIVDLASLAPHMSSTL